MELTKINLENTEPSLTITTTPTSSGALRLLSDQPFDCIVSDYQMPGMNGVQLCAERARWAIEPKRILRKTCIVDKKWTIGRITRALAYTGILKS